MPKKLNLAEQKEKHNMYLSNLLKAQFYKKLQDIGMPSLTGSAAIRALMNMFVENKFDDKEVIKYIEAEIIITPNGKQSKL